MLHTVEFSGPFGFIKPWTAVRDGKINSQQFLTASTVEGIRRKLEVSAILRYKLQWDTISWQQEVTHPSGWVKDSRKQQLSRPRAVLLRGVLVSPVLLLGFASADDAAKAQQQHVCLCRNEDMLLPSAPPRELPETEFNALPGWELLLASAGEREAILVGHNRYRNNEEMYGQLAITLPTGHDSLLLAD